MAVFLLSSRLGNSLNDAFGLDQKHLKTFCWSACLSSCGKKVKTQKILQTYCTNDWLNLKATDIFPIQKVLKTMGFALTTDTLFLHVQASGGEPGVLRCNARSKGSAVAAIQHRG